jgi:hypothetical protein
MTIVEVVEGTHHHELAITSTRIPLGTIGSVLP